MVDDTSANTKAGQIRNVIPTPRGKPVGEVGFYKKSFEYLRPRLFVSLAILLDLFCDLFYRFFIWLGSAFI